MTTDDIERIILNLFEQTRETPGAYYDKAHFMDYLVDPPTNKDNIKNSFKSARKYYTFFEAIELQFGICFTLADQDKFYSLDKFVAKTKERIDNSRGNKMIIRQRMAEKHTYYFEFLLTIILTLFVSYFKIHPVSIILTILWGIAIWWLVGSKLKDRRHNSRLFKIIIGDDTKELK